MNLSLEDRSSDLWGGWFTLSVWSFTTPTTKKAHTFEQECNLRDLPNKILAPEIIVLVAKELDEREESPPWMGTVNDEAFQKNSGHNLLETAGFYLCKKV